MNSTLQILDWRPVARGALRGFLKVQLPSGLILCGCTALVGPHGNWIAPPSKPMLNRDGSPSRDDAGKQKYVPTVEFSSPDVRKRFSAAVLAALLAEHPDAMDDPA